MSWNITTGSKDSTSDFNGISGTALDSSFSQPYKVGMPFSVHSRTDPLVFVFLDTSNGKMQEYLDEQTDLQLTYIEGANLQYKFNVRVGPDLNEDSFLNKLSGNSIFEWILEGCFISEINREVFNDNIDMVSITISFDVGNITHL